MKRFVWIVGVVFLGLSQAYAAPKNYGLVTIAYNDFDTSGVSDKEFAYSAAFGKQIHKQWYAELGYLNLFDFSNDNGEATGDALYLSLLGKASGATGELFYKVGAAKVDVDIAMQCGDGDASMVCSQQNSLAAGVVGLGYDYYVGLRSMVRIEYTHMSGEDSFSTNMFNIGFRYNFN